MTARIIQFEPSPHGNAAEDRFQASVDEDGCIRIVIGNAHGQQAWTLTPRQAVELAEFLNNEWMAGSR